MVLNRAHKGRAPFMSADRLSVNSSLYPRSRAERTSLYISFADTVFLDIGVLNDQLLEVYTVCCGFI